MRLVFVLSFAAALCGQNPEPSSAPTCSLAGHVVNSVTGAPLRKAQVRLMRDIPAPPPQGKSAAPANEPQEALTTAEGEFSFPGLTPGAYRLYADRNGFKARYWGGKGRSSQGQILRLSPVEKRDDISIQLVPLSVITGKVVDEDGDPVPNAHVEALAPVYSPSGRELQPQGSAYTDDLGEYRLHSLEPRKYFLKAEPRAEMRGRHSREALVGAYFPGSVDETGAGPVDLVPGQQLNGIDITLHMGHLIIVSGRVFTPPGATNIIVTRGQYSGHLSTTTSFDPSDPTGRFTQRGLAPGEYVFSARCTVGDQEYHAYLPVTVGSTDIENLELHPAPPVELTGRVRFEGPASEKLASPTIVLNAKLGHSRSMARIQRDGTFASRGLAPDHYLLTLNTFAEAFLKEVRWGNLNVLESGLDLSAGTSASDVKIVISTAVGTLDGTVQNDKQEALADAAVALQAESASSADDPRYDSRFKGAKTGPDGKFHITGITPGRYRLMAWEDVDQSSARFDPQFFQQFAAKGQLVEIAESEQKSVTLQVTPAPEEQQ